MNSLLKTSSGNVRPCPKQFTHSLLSNSTFVTQSLLLMFAIIQCHVHAYPYISPLNPEVHKFSDDENFKHCIKSYDSQFKKPILFYIIHHHAHSERSIRQRSVSNHIDLDATQNQLVPQ